MKRFLLLVLLCFSTLPAFSQAPGSLLEERFFGANYLLNGDAELGPIDVPAFGYRPPHEGGLPQNQSLRGEIKISAWGSTVNGYQVNRPIDEAVNFGNQFFWGAFDMHSQLNRNILVRDFADEFAEGAITLHVSGWFGGFAGRDDSVRIEVDILDGGRRLLSRSTVGNITRADRNDQTQLLYDEWSIVIPEGASGIETRFIMANGGLADNLEMKFLSDNHPNTYTIPPDLHIPRAEAPAGGFSGAQIELEWTVENRGETETGAQWVDRVILSTEPSAVRGTRYNLREFAYISALGPQESYTSRQTVTLPESIQGQYYIMVDADARQRVSEYTTSNNVSEPIPITITTSPYPDLQVTSVVAPATTFSGDSINVSWTVKNFGTGPTVPSQWTDAIYLGESEELDFNFFGLSGQLLQVNDVFVTSFEHDGALQPGESYTVTRRIKLPDSEIGERHIFVFTDKPDGNTTARGGDVFEFLFETNNWRSAPMDIILTPPPDLTVAGASLEGFPASAANPDAPLQPGSGQSGEPLPAQLQSGGSYTLSWTVENQGPGGTRTPFWQDVVFLSESEHFDAEKAVQLRAATIDQPSPLLPDSSYDAEVSFRLPDGLEGSYYLHVYTNFSGQVFEFTFDNNNTRAIGPVSVNRSDYPDLAVTRVAVADGATAGERLRIDWDVTNTGAAAAAGLRTDRIFITTEGEFNVEEVRELGFAQSNRNLAVDDVETMTQAVRLPASLPAGEYWVFVQTNADTTIFEWPVSDNNILGSAPFAVAEYQGAVLSATNIQVPAQAVAGTSIEIGWTVSNDGSGSMLNQPWTERVLLIPADTTLGEVIELDEIRRSAPLEAGASRNRVQSYTLPNGLDHPHYAAIALTYVTPESEGAETQTFRSALPINMDPGPRIDLVITQSDAPGEAAAGEIRQLSWTVTNQGADNTGDQDWFDTIYLVEDPETAGRGRPMARWDHTGGLNAGDSYTATVEVEIPVNTQGEHYWVIVTNTRNRVFEYQASDNNRFIVPVDVSLSPETDLIVTDIQIPEQTLAGEPFTVTWEIQNTGSNTARGRIRDGVYLLPAATETVRLGNAFLLGVAERDIDLAPGERLRLRHDVDASRTWITGEDGELTVSMPGVEPGFYKVAVQTNIRSTIPESDRSNNVMLSDDSLQVSLPEIQASTPVMSAFLPGDAKFFAFDAPAGQDLLFTARTTDGSVATVNLYVRYGQPPTRTRHDRSATQPFTSPQQLRIPDSRQGTYYAMVQLENSDSDTTGVTVDVQVRGFEISGLQPAMGGNVGPVTVRFNGSRFTDSTRVYLEDRNGNRVEAFESFTRSRNEILARYQLNGVAIGEYDVVGVNTDGTETRLDRGFEIITGSGPDVRTFIYSPLHIRSEEKYEFTVHIRNTGDTNALDHFVFVELFGIQTWGRDGDYLPVYFFSIEEQFPEQLGNTPRFYNSRYHTVKLESSYAIPFWFYEIPPEGSIRFRVRVEHSASAPARGGAGGTIYHMPHIIPMPESDFTRSGALSDIESAVGFRMLNYMYEQSVDELIRVTGERTMMRDAGYNGLVDMVTIFAEGGMPSAAGLAGGVGGGAVGYILVAAMYTNPATALLATGVGLGSLVGGTLITMWGTKQTKDALIDEATPLIRGGLNDVAIDRYHIAHRHSTTQAVESKDPNDIIGPEGYGEERWIGVTQQLEYRIRYENDPELASAPAQVVRIVHPLDENTDVRAFRLGSFGFADTTFSVPDNVATFSARLDVRSTHGLFVDIVAGLDVQRREAFWLLRSIDPATGDLITDPMGGYLPVNDSTGVGEGFVTYSIRAHPEAKTGDKIHAEASIFFDNNAPIVTPPIFNTIDADLPESTAEVLVDAEVIEVNWNGSDVGAGFSHADVYMAVDDGAFVRVSLSNGDGPHLVRRSSEETVYRFFSLAYDYAGNREPMKNEADIIVGTSLSPSEAQLPTEFAVRPMYPNPFNPSTTLPFDMPSAGDVTITVYDILGRQVISISPGLLPAGRHQQILNMQRFASGVYFAEIRI
ncbi:MAG: T9SS type A sorting domain-containing protein, partial [Balneolales bacterium]|nr:T9SS type A sorting domain-containing protein [Balneolales bacterium]